MDNMDNKTNKNTQQSGTDGQQQPGKTFTQDEVNKIVQERLSREKEKAAADQAGFEKREQELQRKEALLNAKEILQKKELPESFLDIVANAEDQEAVADSILDGIRQYRGPHNKKAPYTPRNGSPMDPERDIKAKFGLL